MYILLNQELLTLNYKNADPLLLCNLAWIELGSSAYTIGPCDHTTLRGLTDLELKILYRNITGAELETQSRNAVLQILCDLMEAMSVNFFDPNEVETQAACVPEEHKGFYKFVEGAKRPTLQHELFNNAFTSGKLTELELKALQGIYTSLSTKPSSTTPVKREFAERVLTPVKSKDPSEGTTSSKIWKLADSCWLDKGNPTDKASIDLLKKQIVQTLLGEGINRSTITTQLSHWWRNRSSQE